MIRYGGQQAAAAENKSARSVSVEHLVCDSPASRRCSAATEREHLMDWLNGNIKMNVAALGGRGSDRAPGPRLSGSLAEQRYQLALI